MPNLLPRLSHVATALLLSALPFAALAQQSRQDSLLRSGDLVGGRPHAAPVRATTRRPAEIARAANADPLLARLLHESVDIDQVPATQLPDLYDRFLAAVREQRRQWSPRDWDAADATLARLNARYEAVRQSLPLNERLNVRSYQGEFHTLRAARAANQRLGS